MVFLLQASSVGHQIFDDLPVHQRLPAEEVHLQIHPVAGICHQKIQRFLSDLEAHQRTASVIFALFRKTVFAGKVTVMRDMQTQRLDHRLPVLEISDVFLVNILCIKHPCVPQLQKLFHRLLQLGCEDLLSFLL